MGKAINALVNRADEENDSYNPNVVRLSCVDVLHPKGSRDRAIVKKSNRAPTKKIVTAVREVTYLYDKDKVTKGWEIVSELTADRDTDTSGFRPEVVGEITRDYRTPNYAKVEQQEE
jgi:hypothetical protein